MFIRPLPGKSVIRSVTVCHSPFCRDLASQGGIALGSAVVSLFTARYYIYTSILIIVRHTINHVDMYYAFSPEHMLSRG